MCLKIERIWNQGHFCSKRISLFIILAFLMRWNQTVWSSRGWMITITGSGCHAGIRRRRSAQVFGFGFSRPAASCSRDNVTHVYIKSIYPAFDFMLPSTQFSYCLLWKPRVSTSRSFNGSNRRTLTFVRFLSSSARVKKSYFEFMICLELQS